MHRTGEVREGVSVVGVVTGGRGGGHGRRRGVAGPRPRRMAGRQPARRRRAPRVGLPAARGAAVSRGAEGARGRGSGEQLTFPF